jgi:branched-chain amino acid transport system permease protein
VALGGTDSAEFNPGVSPSIKVAEVPKTGEERKTMEETTSLGSSIVRKITKNTAALVVIAGSLVLAMVIGVVAGPSQLVNAIVTGGMWALLAVGLALVFGVANIPYFAHGESFMVGAYVAYFVFNPVHNYLQGNPYAFLSATAPFAAILAAAVAGFILGAILERLLFYPLRLTSRAGEWVMNAFLLTLGISFILTNGTTLVLGPNFRGIPRYWDVEPLQLLGLRVGVDRIIAFAIAIVTIASVWFFLRRTGTGRAIRAVSQDEIGAQMVGINLNSIYVLTLALSTAMATLAGACLLFLFQAYPTVGIIPLYFSWYVVILVGLGNVAGAIVGGFIVAVLQTATQHFIGIGWSSVVPIAVMVLVLIIVPSGIFGSEVKGIFER